MVCSAPELFERSIRVNLIRDPVPTMLRFHFLHFSLLFSLQADILILDIKSKGNTAQIDKRVWRKESGRIRRRICAVLPKPYLS